VAATTGGTGAPASRNALRQPRVRPSSRRREGGTDTWCTVACPDESRWRVSSAAPASSSITTWAMPAARAPATATSGTSRGTAASAATPGGSNVRTTTPASGWASTDSIAAATVPGSASSITLINTAWPAARAPSSMPSNVMA
jgi:hypothetical protein